MIPHYWSQGCVFSLLMPSSFSVSQGTKGQGGLPGSDGDPGEDVSGLNSEQKLFENYWIIFFVLFKLNLLPVIPQGPIGVPGLMGEPGLFGVKVYLLFLLIVANIRNSDWLSAYIYHLYINHIITF